MQQLPPTQCLKHGILRVSLGEKKGASSFTRGPRVGLMRVKAVLSGGGPTRIRPTRGPRVKEPAPFFPPRDTLKI